MPENQVHILTRAVIVQQNHILVCKSTDLDHNFYYLPGGHVEQGETVQEALTRELIEETTYKIKIGRFLGCLENLFEYSETCNCHNQEYSFIFEASINGLNVNINDPLPQVEENTELLWLALSELGKVHFKAKAYKELLPLWLGLGLELGAGVDQAFCSVRVQEH